MSNSGNYGLVAEDIAHIGVYMVLADEPLMKVLDIMDRKNVSAVIVEDLEDMHNYYLISHSDIIHFLAQQRSYLDFLGVVAGGRSLLQEVKARDVMRGPLDIVKKGTPIDEIIQRMHESGFKRLILGNDAGQPIGIVSTQDILAWNNDFFRKGTPILICVMENHSGIILAQRFFRKDFGEELLELFGGSLTAITSITSEVLKESGNLRVIEKDYYVIMLEPGDYTTGVLVADYQSIDLRRKLQHFLFKFEEDYREDLEKRKKYPGPINVFKIRDLTTVFD